MPLLQEAAQRLIQKAEQPQRQLLLAMPPEYVASRLFIAFALFILMAAVATAGYMYWQYTGTVRENSITSKAQQVVNSLMAKKELGLSQSFIRQVVWPAMHSKPRT